MTALFFFPGLLLGAWHFGSLHWLTGRLAGSGQVPWVRLLALQLLRFAVLGGACYGASRAGALALLALGLGVVAARPLVLHLTGARRPPAA
ncbi:MAG: ATP synthase subunit I [Burkholderiaceae bacterium]|nr:ATP synthase subunit I [Burkholderiaceae bacterium]